MNEYLVKLREQWGGTEFSVHIVKHLSDGLYCGQSDFGDILFPWDAIAQITRTASELFILRETPYWLGYAHSTQCLIDHWAKSRTVVELIADHGAYQGIIDEQRIMEDEHDAKISFTEIAFRPWNCEVQKFGESRLIRLWDVGAYRVGTSELRRIETLRLNE